MAYDINIHLPSQKSHRHLARIVFVSFLLVFILARILVFLIMSRRIPDLFIYMGGTHIHHLNFGIFLLAAVGAYLLFRRPLGLRAELAAAVYGMGMALTFDEFGMWLHLGGSYWQRASWDAIIVLTSVFAIIGFAPSFKRFRLSHWIVAGAIAIAVIIFFFLFFGTLK